MRKAAVSSSTDMDLHNMLIPLYEADVKELRTILKLADMLEPMLLAGSLGALLRGVERGLLPPSRDSPAQEGERGVMRRKDFGR